MRELRRADYTAGSVYFGGGTPSCMDARLFYEMLSLISLEAGAEVSLEVNPDDADLSYLRDLKSAGVNRLSVGVQSLNDGELAVLGRRHDAAAALKAVKNAYDAGFENISADIMLGLPGQTVAGLRKTAAALTAAPLKHISAYILSLAPGTPAYSSPSFTGALPSEDETADLYLECVRLLEEGGFSQYEISNFAAAGFECRHNLKYWNSEEYLGFGPGAHSYVGGKRTACRMTVGEYLASVRADVTVTDEKAGGFYEAAMLKIRLGKSGFDLSAYPDKEAGVLEKAKPFAEEGLLNINGSVLALTPRGCLLSNGIIVSLFM
jgi:oxygen-independent coproporphyrinogen-3 oxidase